MKKYTYLGISFLLPVISFAQYLDETQPLLDAVQSAMGTVIAIAVLLAFLFFVWGIADFIRRADDSTGREEGRQRMIWGIVALAVLATIWGIVRWLQGEFALDTMNQSAPGIFKLFDFGGK